MMQIFRYQFEVKEIQFVKMPKGAAVLTVQVVDGEPQLWVEADPNALTVKRKFVMRGEDSSADFEYAKHYVGTLQLRGGGVVIHVYTDRKEYTE